MSTELEEIKLAIEELADAVKDAKPPVVNVPPIKPVVKVPAPVTKETPALKREPISYNVTVTDRDDTGAIRTLTIKPL